MNEALSYPRISITSSILFWEGNQIKNNLLRLNHLYKYVGTVRKQVRPHVFISQITRSAWRTLFVHIGDMLLSQVGSSK